MRYLISLVLVLVTLNLYAPYTYKEMRTFFPSEKTVTVETNKTVETAELIKVREYLQKYYPTTPLKAEWIIKYAEMYEISPAFILTIGQVETSLGTDPKAYRCKLNKTVFSVGEFDDGTSLYTNKTYEEGLDRFCRLIANYYLVNKTELELLGNFRNVYGQRYASAPAYEQVTTQIYGFINRFIDS